MKGCDEVSGYRRPERERQPEITTNIWTDPIVVYHGAVAGMGRVFAQNGIESPFDFNRRRLKERWDSDEIHRRSFKRNSFEPEAYRTAALYYPQYKDDPFELHCRVFGVPISLDLDIAARHARRYQSMGGIVVSVILDEPQRRIYPGRRGEDGCTNLFVDGVIRLKDRLVGVYYSEETVRDHIEILGKVFCDYRTDISPLSEVSPMKEVFEGKASIS